MSAERRVHPSLREEDVAGLLNLLQPIEDAANSVVTFFATDLGFGFGVGIILLTFVTRIVILPLSIRQIKSMRALQAYSPQIKELNERYKDDPQRQQQETMKFYRENQVNPFASCLPMVAQLPVFLSLYYMLRTDLRHDICPDVNPVGTAHPVPCGESPESSFLFIPDLTSRARAFGIAVR